MDLKDKIVFITGSSLGIGRATAKEFFKEGAKPIITYFKDKEEALKLSKELNTKAYFLDVRDSEIIKEVLSEVSKEFGGIDVLINNAGVIYWKTLENTSLEEIEEQIRVNLEGLIKVTKLALPYNPKFIINIGSGASKTAYPSLATYCSTKFGVRGFSYALKEELFAKGIEVRLINPRSTKTRMTNFKGDPPESVAKLIVKVVKGEIKEFEVDVWNYL